MRFNNTPATVTLRANRLQLTRDQLADALGPMKSPCGRPLGPGRASSSIGPSLRGVGLRAGWFSVQDEASQLVAMLAGDVPGPRVLDAVRRPGARPPRSPQPCAGKGLLIASDVRDRRVDLLRRTVGCERRDERRIVQAEPALSRFPSPRGSISSSWTRRAQASARCVAIRTSAGAGSRPTCRPSPPRS